MNDHNSWKKITTTRDTEYKDRMSQQKKWHIKMLFRFLFDLANSDISVFNYET